MCSDGREEAVGASFRSSHVNSPGSGTNHPRKAALKLNECALFFNALIKVVPRLQTSLCGRLLFD